VRNHALTIFETTPGFAITIIVTEVASAESSAYWYSAWMIATAVYIIPGMFGMTLFAAAVEPEKELRRTVWESLTGSLTLGIVAAIGVSALGRPLLDLFGEQYADAGVAPLRVLVVAVIPLAVVSAYFALCRATDRLGEATFVAVLGGSAGLAVAAVAAIEADLVEVAASWVAVQAIAGGWAAWRLRILTRHARSDPRPRPSRDHTAARVRSRS
jgi:O-antigen/teichoic acid export membrane protein